MLHGGAVIKSDQKFMQRAIELAQRVDLSRDVNPAVGSVVVDSDGNVIGEGWHEGSGTLHAEMLAIKNASEKARGATVYITLEPCANVGKQGACTTGLIEAGVARVVYGQSDPNPKMSGGAQLLKNAGLEVIGGVLNEECEALNSTWTFAHRNNRPWVIWKTATTLDGFIAPKEKSRIQITCEESREYVQKLRSQVGAVVTGTGTALIDDPLLTVREVPDEKQPLRVVVGQTDLPNSLRLLQGSTPAIQLKTDLESALKSLWSERGIHCVLLEAGQGLSSSAWRDGLVDEVYWFQAPKILGDGLQAVGDFGLSSLNDAPRFSQVEVNRVGLDLLIHFLT